LAATVPTSRELQAQIGWFIGLRFLAVGAAAAVTGVAHLLGYLSQPLPLWVLAGATLACNVAYLAWLRRNPTASATTLRRHVDLQIGVDLLLLTAMLHCSGGVTNPGVLFYLFHGFIAALVLSLRAASLVAGVALLLVALLAFGEWGGWLPHHPVGFALFELPPTPVHALVVYLAALAMTFTASIYFVATVVRRLRASEADLQTLGRQLVLSEKLAAVGTLAAGVSHEINNPVGVIQNKVDVLRYRIADGDPPENLLPELAAIEKHVRRIGVITAGLLAFAREAPFELRALDLDALVEEGIDLVRVPLQSAGLRLQLELDPARPRIRGSANHLLQVLVNILLNAKDASPPGARVWVRTESRDGEVAVVIRDEGVGIPAANLEKIFDPFFTTKDVDRGTGLGLAISHGIVERHGGRILVESTLGSGSTFTVLVPELDRDTQVEQRQI
jgi:signal transduction histidine kinase